MSELQNVYQTEYDQKLVAHMRSVYKHAHEIGLMMQRQLEEMDALPDGSKLFLTRAERRGMPK